MAGESVDESGTSFAVHKRRKTTNSAAQPENTNIVDSQPVKDPSPSKFTWRIERFSLRNEKKLCSDVFEAGGYKWYFAYTFPKSIHDVHLSITTYMQQQFKERPSSWGLTSFMPLGALFDRYSGFLVNDTLVVDVTCNVAEKDTAERLRERLKKDQEENKYKNIEKAPAHLYTFIKVVRDEDLAEQIGKDIYFDLVNHDKVRSFQVPKQTSFSLFKVGQYSMFTEVDKAELILFLEVERWLDLRPITPLKKRKDDILLFFKLYDPQTEELRYVGRLFVNRTRKPSEILTRLNKLAGYDPEEEIGLYEEIKFEPNVMCEPVDKQLAFRESKLEDGDIICFQKTPSVDKDKHIRFPDVPSYLEYVHNGRVLFPPTDKETEDEESLEEQNENIIAKETNVDKNIEAQQSKGDIETSHHECTSKSNTSKLVSIDLEEFDPMIDEDVIAAIDRVLSEGITISLQSQHSVQRQVSKLDSNLPEQLLQELRDIAFKEDLVEKFKEGRTPKVKFNAVKEKIDANAGAFSSHQLEQVGVVVNLLNNIVRMFEKLENLKKEIESVRKSTGQDNEVLKKTRQKILTSRTSFKIYQTQLNSLDAQIVDLKAELEKLQGDRTKIAEMQDQEKDKITSFNKEVKSTFHRLADDQIKLRSVEDKFPEAEAELESHEKLYQNFRAVPPF